MDVQREWNKAKGGATSRHQILNARTIRLYMGSIEGPKSMSVKVAPWRKAYPNEERVRGRWN